MNKKQGLRHQKHGKKSCQKRSKGALLPMKVNTTKLWQIHKMLRDRTNLRRVGARRMTLCLLDLILECISVACAAPWPVGHRNEEDYRFGSSGSRVCLWDHSLSSRMVCMLGNLGAAGSLQAIQSVINLSRGRMAPSGARPSTGPEKRSGPRAGPRLDGVGTSRWRPPARSLRGRDRRSEARVSLVWGGVGGNEGQASELPAHLCPGFL